MHVAKALSFDIVKFFLFYREPPPPPPPRVAVLRRGGIKEIALISLISPLLNTAIQGGIHSKKRKKFIVSKLRARTPSLGRVGQGAWELGFAQIGGAIF